jgi:hypothetical protein
MHVRATSVGSAFEVLADNSVALAFRPWYIHEGCAAAQLLAGRLDATAAVLKIDECFCKHAV